LASDIKLTLQGLKKLVFNPQIWIIGGIGCFMFLPITAFAELWAVNFLVNVGFEKQSAAWGSSMVFLGFAVGGPLWGAFSDKIKSRKIPLIIGSFMTAALMAWIIWLPTTHQLFMFSGLFLVGFFSGSEILVFALGNDLADSKASATAASFINMFTMVGGMFLPPLIGRLLDKAVLLSGDQLPTVHDYSIALTAIPVGLCIAGIFSIILKETYHKLRTR
jgi:MFS family permease